MSQPRKDKVHPWPSQADSGQGIHLAEARHDRPSPYPLHRHTVHELTLILDGEGQLRHGKLNVPLSLNDLTYVRPATAHQLLDSDAHLLTRYTLFFQERVLPESVRALLPGLAKAFLGLGRVPLSAHPMLTAILTDFRELSREASLPRPTRRAAQAVALAALVVKVSRLFEAKPATARSSAEARVAALIPLYREGIHRPMDLSAAAAAVPLGRRQFTRVFRSVTGFSWVAWRQREKLALAEERLKAGSSAVRAAFEAGFDSPSNFHRVYKRLRGRTPRQG